MKVMNIIESEDDLPKGSVRTGVERDVEYDGRTYREFTYETHHDGCLTLGKIAVLKENKRLIEKTKELLPLKPSGKPDIPKQAAAKVKKPMPRSPQITLPAGITSLTRATFPAVSQAVLQQTYGKRMPDVKDVTVDYKGERTRWGELTTAQKLEILQPHVHGEDRRFVDEQLEGALSDYADEIADRLLTMGKHGQEPRPFDPRSDHGCDHGVRAAIFGAVFAGLYAEKGETLTPEELLAMQLVCLGHDCGRQTEGVDIYNRDTAEIMKGCFRQLGLSEHYADHIEGKDEPLDGKPLIARCLQNADAADYPRLFGPAFAQEQSVFESSRNYLDIARQYPDLNRKVDIVRREIHGFIDETHHRVLQNQALARYLDEKSITTYYEAMLGLITAKKYPVMHRILSELGVITT